MAGTNINIQPSVNNSSIVLAEQSKLTEMSEAFSYEGNKVTMRLDNGVVFVNLTEVAKAFPDKNLSQIINSKEIQEYTAKLSAKLKIYSSADLLKVTRGGNGNQGTWAHQRVALRVAQRLSTDFALWVDEKIEEILTKGYTSLIPKTFSEALFLAAENQKLIEEQNRMIRFKDKQIKELEDDIHFFDSLISSSGLIPVKKLSPNYGMAADEFNMLLKDMGIQYKQGGTWILRKPYIKEDYARVVPVQINHKTRPAEIIMSTQWTLKGVKFLYKKLKERNIIPLAEKLK